MILCGFPQVPFKGDSSFPGCFNVFSWICRASLHQKSAPVAEPRLPGCPSDKAAVSQKPPVWIQLCLHRFVPSCAGDRATAPGCHPAAPAGPPWSWMAVAAARSVPGAWESPATSCTSVTRARASSVTTAQHLQGQEPPATVSTGVPLFPGDPPHSSPAPVMTSLGYRHPAALPGEWLRLGKQLS